MCLDRTARRQNGTTDRLNRAVGRQLQPLVRRRAVRSRHILYTSVQGHGLHISQHWGPGGGHRCLGARRRPWTRSVCSSGTTFAALSPWQSSAVAMGSVGPPDTSGSSGLRLRDFRASRSDRGDPKDARTRPPSRSRRRSRATRRMLARDRHRDHGGDPRAAWPASLLGCEEAPDHPEEAASSGRLACEIDRLRSSLPTRHDRPKAATEVSRSPGEARSVDGGPERHLVRRLQGRVQDR